MPSSGYISKVTLPDGSEYKLKQGPIPVIGTQTATTASWTGNIDVDELYDGLTIAYYLPRTSATDATLNLTLADGTTTGAIPIYSSAARIATKYPAGSTIILTYWSAGSINVNGTATTTAQWQNADYYVANTNTVGEYGGSCVAGANGMARYSLIMQVSEEHWESFVLSSGTGTSKTKNTSGFLINSPILYQSAGTYASGSAAGQSGTWISASFDTRYSTNGGQFATAGQNFFIVGTITDGKFYLANTWWSTNLPTSDDGLYYIYIGQFYSKYQATLHAYHPIFYYKDGEVHRYTPGNSENAFTVNGHTVATDVPANAKFTDTTYTPASESPKMDGTAAVGTSVKYAREDHIHPTDTSRVPTTRKVNNKALSSDITLSASDVSAIATSAKGTANGVAELDANGKVPSSQLPSYVDDVLEYSSKSGFPTTGETGKIYVDTGTNLTYRWSGSAYVEISQSLALGETSSTAYRGDYGKAAYAHAVTNKGSAFSSGLYKITTNSEGHVTAATAVAKADITALGIPGSDTNDAVTQTQTATNANYEVLFSSTADNTTRTEGARKNNNLTFNPSTGKLTATSFSGSLDPSLLSAGYIRNSVYISHHPESTANSTIPFIYNDLAFLLLKSGAVETYTTTATDYTPVSINKTAVSVDMSNAFDGSPSYVAINVAKTSKFVIDITCHKLFSYNNVFYVDFGSDLWRAKSITLLVMNKNTETAFTQKGAITSNPYGHWRCDVSHASTNSSGETVHGFNKIRIVLTDFVTNNKNRIAQIGLISFGSAGVRETYMSRGIDDHVYRNITPNVTNTYSLGTSSLKWKNVYSNTLNGTTIPNSPKFTDTTYTASKENIGSASAGTAIPADDITSWSAGTAASASVTKGVLTITNGTAPSLSYTAKSIPNISVTSKSVVTGITAG